ncbi:hypothetical protein AB1Y20_009265 [Prymnesium parvum]|uniref:MAM domain-containing protein n=1 Tax=Prymnesium parvum TaxID=97485 RepID=A0AB34K649_PRYPA
MSAFTAWAPLPPGWKTPAAMLSMGREYAWVANPRGVPPATAVSPLSSMYAEMTSQPKGETPSVFSLKYDGRVCVPRPMASISFSYYMFGGGVGRLELLVSKNASVTRSPQSYVTLWARDGSQGGAWLDASMVLPEPSDGLTQQLYFRAINSSGNKSSIALADVVVKCRAPAPRRRLQILPTPLVFPPPPNPSPPPPFFVPPPPSPSPPPPGGDDDDDGFLVSVLSSFHYLIYAPGLVFFCMCFAVSRRVATQRRANRARLRAALQQQPNAVDSSSITAGLNGAPQARACQTVYTPTGVAVGVVDSSPVFISQPVVAQGTFVGSAPGDGRYVSSAVPMGAPVVQGTVVQGTVVA